MFVKATRNKCALSAHELQNTQMFIPITGLDKAKPTHQNIQIIEKNPSPTTNLFQIKKKLLNQRPLLEIPKPLCCTENSHRRFNLKTHRLLYTSDHQINSYGHV